mmetsp:Transcript_9436/g.25598  ORF Transcript_9436/g.25598 Transcript_9436/m.25598 type:complete len:154 (-) Transcript_9436:18-479(-)
MDKVSSSLVSAPPLRPLASLADRARHPALRLRAWRDAVNVIFVVLRLVPATVATVAAAGGRDSRDGRDVTPRRCLSAGRDHRATLRAVISANPPVCMYGTKGERGCRRLAEGSVPAGDVQSPAGQVMIRTRMVPYVFRRYVRVRNETSVRSFS